MFKWMCNHRGPPRRMNSGKDAFTSKTMYHCAELQVFRVQASEDRQPCIYIAFGSGSAIYLIEPLGYTKSAVKHCSLATKPVWDWSKVNRSIHFPVLVFLVLVGMLLLLTGSEIFSRASRPKPGFERDIVKSCVWEEGASSINNS